MSISVQAPTGARPSWALLYFNFSKIIKDKTHKFQQLFLSINYYFAYSIVEIYAFFLGGEDQTDPRFVCGGPNSISRTGKMCFDYSFFFRYLGKLEMSGSEIGT